MAKSQTSENGSKAPVQFATVASEKASQELSALRSGRRGRTSQFEPLFEAVSELEDGKSIRMELTKTQYLNLGQQLRKRFGKEIKVSTAASKDAPDTRIVFISHAPNA